MKPQALWKTGLTTGLLLLSVAASDAAVKTYRYYQFAPSRLRDNPNIANSCQMSEFQFKLGENIVPVTNLTITNPGGDNPGTELPSNLKDANLGTKWLDFKKQPLVFDFGVATPVDSYNFGTGGDAPERDPVDWVLYGSTDNINWVPLDIRTNYTANPGRGAYQTAAFVIPETMNPVITSYTTSGTVVKNGSTVNLSWHVDLADSVTISGIGSVPTVGSQSVVPANNAFTNYTLTAVNSLNQAVTTSTITVKTVAGGTASYRYVKFTPTKIRDISLTTAVQMSEIYFILNGGLTPRPISATNPGGSNAADAGEGALKAIDGNSTSKWLDGNRQPLIMDFGETRDFDAYVITTANDAISRDPVRWRLEGSADGNAWTIIDDMTRFDYPVTTSRNTDTPDILLPGSSLNPSILNFSTDAPTLVSGQPAVLSWTTSGAETVSIDHGVGTVTGNGTFSVSPTTTTTYTLTTTKAGAASNTAQVTINVINPTNTSITYPNFDNAGSELIYVQDASLLNDFANRPGSANAKRLRITPDLGSKNGAVWFAKRVDLSQGFDTSFDMNLITTAGNGGADGMAFVVQNVSNSTAPATNQDKGFPTNSLAVNFDSYINGTEASAATVQIVVNGVSTKIVDLPTEFPLILGAENKDLTQTTTDAAPYHARVTYGSGKLNVYLSGYHVVTDYAVNLMDIGAVNASGKAYVGFGARTGGIFETHDVTAWTLVTGPPAVASNPLAITSSSINVAAGTATLTWSSTTGKTYRITSSSDLTTFGTVLQTGIASGGASTSATVNFTPGTKGFFRVEEL